MRRGAPIDTMLGDAVVSAVNDRDERVRRAAYGALGAMRYDRAVQALIDVVPRLERNALVMWRWTRRRGSRIRRWPSSLPVM
jgi:HEAT repeat protein